MSDSMADAPGAPAPIFEGSEKRLELHFSFCHTADSSGTPPDTRGLRCLDRATLDHLMTLAACEILSSTSNHTFDAYVLSESSLFVYPTAWVLKTCGNTRPLACLEELLRTTAQHNVKLGYVKYSHASYLHPALQPVEYQTFPTEVEALRQHVGHLGNGGSAYQLGDSLYGLQWHVFVASEPSFVPNVEWPTDCVMAIRRPDEGCGQECPPDRAPASPTAAKEACVGKVPEAPLKTLEICMTELDVEASQQFVRTPAFVSSARTTRDSGIDTLLPGAQLDDHMFEPCGYSMNGIKGSQHITIHVTPEEEFSYASCEIHGCADDFVDPSATVAAVTSIFAPGRFVVSYATTTTSPPAANAAPEPPPCISLAGYCCVGASCQDLPAGAAVFFFSFVRDTFRAAFASGKSCPQALRSCPSFCTLSTAAVLSVERSMELDEADKAPTRKLGSCGTHSSASDMDVQAQDDCCDVGDGSTGAANGSELSPAEYACELIETNAPSDTFFLLDFRALSANLATWKATLPSVTLLHNVRDCDDSALLRHMHEQGVCFLAETIGQVEALSSAGVAMAAVVATVQRWRSRDVRRAVELGVWSFRIATVSELELLQRYSGAPGSSHCEVHIVISNGTETGNLLRALTGDQASKVSELSVSGVVLDVIDCSLPQESALDAAQGVCAALKAAGHSMHSIAFMEVEGGPLKAASLLASARQHAWLQGFKTAIDCHDLMIDVLMMFSCVLYVDTAAKRMHVTDVPLAHTDVTVQLLRTSMDQRSSQGSKVSAAEQYTVADGSTSAVFTLPDDSCSGGDWLWWRGCSAVDVPSAFWAVDRYYL